MSKLKVIRHSNAQEMRRARTRAKLAGSTLPRLVVFRSNKYMFAQVIEPVSGEAIVGFRGEKSEEVGETIAKRAVKAGVLKVVFDRGAYSYHGRVKTLAEAARKGGLTF